MREIYLDYNATTPIAPGVVSAMQPFLSEHFGNPSSGHALGRAAAAAIEHARQQVADLIGSERDEVIFTGGGTEASNLAIKGIMTPPEGGHLIISAIEHPATSAPAAYLERLGIDVSVVPCNTQGVIEPDWIETALRPDTRLVSIMHANNEIGVVQPIAEISEICRSRQVLLHTDAAQSIGKIRAHVEELGVDLMSIAGHKFYAPKGVGALFVRAGVALEPVIHGAGHEGGMRPGTENTPYIVGLGAASEIVHKNFDDAVDRMANLRDRLLERLRTRMGGRLSVNGEQAERLPNTLSANFPGVSGAELLSRAPELCASTGSACHTGATSLSNTLTAIGLSPEKGRGTVRLSVGWYTSEEDVDRAAELLLGAWEEISS